MDEYAQKTLLLEQYKAYLADLQSIGGRLETNRSFMLSILTLLFLFLSLAGKDGALINIAPQLTWVVLLVAIVICIAWFFRIKTYGAIIKSKFKILHEIESELPFQCFKREWETFSSNKPIYLITIGQWIPIILIFAFISVVTIQRCATS